MKTTSTIERAAMRPALALLVGCLCVLSNCSPRLLVLERIASGLPNYFFPKGSPPEQFDTIGNGVYSFRLGFDRTFVVRGPRGFLVVDCFNDRLARRLREVLRERFGNDRIEVLVVSHYHLDHSGGISVLQPDRIVAHERVPQYLADVGASARLRLPLRTGGSTPVELLRGDHSFSFGDRTVHLLHLGKSHTDTLYAVYLPKQRVLYGPDLAFVRAMPPAGMPDIYYPGFVRALDRVLALDFDVFVPSHFGIGTKKDVADFRKMTVVVRAALERRLARLEGPPRESADAREMIRGVYEELLPLYGDWHGFHEMFFATFQRNLAGGYLGF